LEFRRFLKVEFGFRLHLSHVLATDLSTPWQGLLSFWWNVGFVFFWKNDIHDIAPRSEKPTDRPASLCDSTNIFMHHPPHSTADKSILEIGHQNSYKISSRLYAGHSWLGWNQVESRIGYKVQGKYNNGSPHNSKL
jgi:hypothetical protein